MGVAVVSAVVRRYFRGGPVLQRIEVKGSTGVVDDRGFVLGPSRVSVPDWFPFLVGKRLGVCDGAFLNVKVSDIESTSGHLALEPFRVLKTNIRFTRGDTDPVQGAVLC